MRPAQQVAHDRYSTNVNPPFLLLDFLVAPTMVAYLSKCHKNGDDGIISSSQMKRMRIREVTQCTGPMKPKEKTTSKIHLSGLLPLQCQQPLEDPFHF